MFSATTPLETWGDLDWRRKLAAGEIIPTWQQGMAQERPDDLLKFAEDGYSKNSLIYACIREKATSFAALPPVLVRTGGDMVRSHRLLTLLENPNTYQDGAEFREELKTQLEAAGNVYIEKVRRAGSADRRREFATYPVQELSLVRPDYVKIAPGASRVDDTFVVEVAGEPRRRIARRDVIHIRDVNLINDFYGLSKIALLVREGSIDLHMSDFELAFFKNAGVPLGLMLVKRGRQPEIDEAKRRFDRLFNGVSGWFRSLWLNAEDAEYKQLALAPSQMEQTATRFHVESRICTVFGVHPAIVHARVANEMPQQQYEEIEHAFWAETMVPDTKRIASALTKQLLPEFANTRDGGAVVDFDTSGVRALQEDRSRKLREAVRLIITGGVTVATAFESVGLPVPSNSDFYVRTGNQVVVLEDGTLIPMAGEPEQQPSANNPLEGAAEAMVDAILKDARCRKCNKLLARALAPGSEVECSRCSEVLTV